MCGGCLGSNPRPLEPQSGNVAGQIHATHPPRQVRFSSSWGDLGGGARNSLQDAIGYAKERKAFGNGINPRRDLFEKLSAEIARQIGKRPPLKTPHGASLASSAFAYLRASAFPSASATTPTAKVTCRLLFARQSAC